MLCRIKIGIKSTLIKRLILTDIQKSKFNFVIVKIFKLTGSPYAIEDGRFCLQTTRSEKKVQLIMARCGPNLQTSRVLFSFLKQTNYFFGT